METIASQRGCKKFIDDGFCYLFDKTSYDKQLEFWRCEKRGSCKARIHVAANTKLVVKYINIHTHGANAAQVEAMKVVAEMKKKAEETVESPAQIINGSVQNMSNACQGAMPNINALTPTQTQRNSRGTIKSYMH